MKKLSKRIGKTILAALLLPFFAFEEKAKKDHDYAARVITSCVTVAFAILVCREMEIVPKLAMFTLVIAGEATIALLQRYFWYLVVAPKGEGYNVRETGGHFFFLFNRDLEAAIKVAAIRVAPYVVATIPQSTSENLFRCVCVGMGVQVVWVLANAAYWAGISLFFANVRKIRADQEYAARWNEQ